MEVGTWRDIDSYIASVREFGNSNGLLTNLSEDLMLFRFPSGGEKMVQHAKKGQSRNGLQRRTDISERIFAGDRHNKYRGHTNVVAELQKSFIFQKPKDRAVHAGADINHDVAA